MATIVLISERDADLEFAQNVSAFLKGESLQVKSVTDLKKVIKEVKDPVFFWDVDHKNSIDVGHPMSIGRISQVLEEFKNPKRVFVLTDNAMNKTPFLFNLHGFSHNIVRQFDAAAPRAVATAIERSGHKVTTEGYLDKAFPGASIVVKDQVLIHSKDRRTVVTDFQKYLEGIDLNPQIASIAVQGADELLMNAIFDAPCKGGSNYYRRKERRDSEYPLLDQERVSVTYGATDDWVVFGAKDQFGSVRKNSLLGSVRRDYEKLEYTPPEDDHGAGLGIYGIMQGGLSLIFTGKAQSQTEVMLLIPRLNSLKSFRTAFRFFCFYI